MGQGGADDGWVREGLSSIHKFFKPSDPIPYDDFYHFQSAPPRINPPRLNFQVPLLFLIEFNMKK